MHVVSLLAQWYFFQSLMNASDFVCSPVKMGGGLPISLSPVFCPPAAVTGAPGFPPLPPLPPPPPPWGTPPGSPAFPPLGILADQTGNPHPEDGCIGGSGQSGWRAWNVATSSLVYIWPVRGLIAPSLIVVVVVCASVIGKSLMCNSAASLAMALTAGAWHTRMTLGELLWLDGDVGHEGVVFSGAGAGSLGANCWVMYRSTSVGKMLSPKSRPAIQNASQCPPCSKFSCQQTSTQQALAGTNSTGYQCSSPSMSDQTG